MLALQVVEWLVLIQVLLFDLPRTGVSAGGGILELYFWACSVTVFLQVAGILLVLREHYRLGVPEQCWYEEVFSSDSEFYAGSNIGNGPGVQAEAFESHGRPYSVELKLPPLGITVLKPRR